MKCSIRITERQFKQSKKAKNFVSGILNDEVVGGEFRVVLTPLEHYEAKKSSSRVLPTYYYRKTDGGYIVEGEGYFITEDYGKNISAHASITAKRWGSDMDIQWLPMEDEEKREES